MVVWFNHGGRGVAESSWQGPGLNKQEIPASALTTDQGKPMMPLGAEQFVLDPQKAAQGKSLFASLGCAACHRTGPDPIASSLQAPALDRLNANAPGGCIDAAARKGAARFALSNVQRDALRAALANRAELSRPLTSSQNRHAHDGAAELLRVPLSRRGRWSTSGARGVFSRDGQRRLRGRRTHSAAFDARR